MLMPEVGVADDQQGEGGWGGRVHGDMTGTQIADISELRPVEGEPPLRAAPCAVLVSKDQHYDNNIVTT